MLTLQFKNLLHYFKGRFLILITIYYIELLQILTFYRISQVKEMFTHYNLIHEFIFAICR